MVHVCTQRAFQTMQALQKEVNGVKWCRTKRRGSHPLQLSLNTRSSLGLRLPKCSVRLSGRARGGPRVGPQAGPNWPKITKNGPRCFRGGPQKGPMSKLMDEINSGDVWVAFWPFLDPCGPETVSVRPKMGSFVLRMCLTGCSLKMAADAFPMCKRPL